MTSSTNKAEPTKPESAQDDVSETEQPEKVKLQIATHQSQFY